MASGDQVMRISGDFSGYVAGAKKAEEATGKIAKKAGGIGDEVGKAMIKIDLLKMGLLKAYQLVEAINTKNVEASRSSDDRAIAVGIASGSLGVDPYKAKAIIENRKGAGSKNADEDTSFLESLVSINKSRPVPLSQEESLGALGLFHRRGALGSGSGGSEIQEGLSKGYSLDQIAQSMAAKRGGASEDAAAAIARQNAESGSAIGDQADRSAAGAEMRAWRIFQDKRSRESRFQEAKDFFVPDVVEKGYYDFHDSFRRGRGGDSVDGGYRQTVDQTEAAIDLGREVRGMRESFDKIQVRPNGNTGVP